MSPRRKGFFPVLLLRWVGSRFLSKEVRKRHGFATRVIGVCGVRAVLVLLVTRAERARCGAEHRVLLPEVAAVQLRGDA